MKTNLFAATCLLAASLHVAAAQDLQLVVDRTTGGVDLQNVGDATAALKGYTIGSTGNFLSLDNWSSLADSGSAGWVEANPSVTYLSELNRSEALLLDAGASVNLGTAYVTGAHNPDLFFEYITTDLNATTGSILYTGPANDLAVYVDPASGDASIANLSPFLDPISVKGYSILSASSGLSASTWASIAGAAGGGWVEANPTAEHLSELNRTESTTFSNSNPVSIGQILSPGSDVRDLVFEYFTVDGEVRTGSVEYIPLPGSGAGGCDPSSGGDLDGNGIVEFADFLVLSANFGQSVSSHEQGDIDCSGTVDFADFLALSSNFGSSVGGAAAVPEPSGVLMLGMAVLGMSVMRRRSRL